MNNSSQNFKSIVNGIEETLTHNKFDYQKYIRKLSEITSNSDIQNRFNEHIRGLILAQLSNNRPWRPIMDSLDKLKKVFKNYDASEIEKIDAETLLNDVVSIKCGNRSIKRQIYSLKENIKKFREIESKYDSIDDFIITYSKPTPENVAKLLSDNKSKYKIKNLGFALSMEYLRNVGVEGAKPDIHIIRICGDERLGIFPKSITRENASLMFRQLCQDNNLDATYVDGLMWLFGAKDFGEICSANPKCNLCKLQNVCNYSKKDKINPNPMSSPIHEIKGTAIALPLIKTVSLYPVEEGYEKKIKHYEIEIEYLKTNHFVDENGTEIFRSEQSIFTFKDKEQAEKSKAELIAAWERYHSAAKLL